MTNIEIDTSRLKSIINESIDTLNPDKEGHIAETIAVSQVAEGIQIQVIVTRNKLHYIAPSNENICIESS